MIGVMMTVDTVEHLNAHAEKSCGLPLVDAGLHEPCRRGVPQRVRSNLAIKLCLSQSALECCLYGLDRLSVKLNEMRVHDTFLFPATKVRKSRRDGSRRLAFICFSSPFRQAIVNTALEVNE
jgi:hypothetical protein